MPFYVCLNTTKKELELGMDNFYQSISRRPKMMKYASIIFLIFESIFVFPIRYDKLTMFNLYLLLFFVVIGCVFGALYRAVWYKPLFIVTISSVIGLMFRVWLEWGEVTITVDLTLWNVMMTYIPIIVVVMIGYLLSINSETIKKSYLTKINPDDKID